MESNKISNFNYLYEIKISEYIQPEYIEYFEDVIRMITLQFIIQFMYFIKSPNENTLFSYNFIELVLYIIIGLSVYWLIFKKVIKLN
jgi:hypothetical protein